nr:MAG TPA: hypothetical protein [Caudoviricetes sp.]
MRFTPTFNGVGLDLFRAKMQSYPVISSCEVDTEVFQGVNRSSFQLLKNRRGARTMVLTIDFFGTNPERTRNQSALEALLLGGVSEIDIGDGCFYRAVLVKTGDPETLGECVTSVVYTFRATRHTRQIVTAVEPNGKPLLCVSNVPQTDCEILLSKEKWSGGTSILITLNTVQRWSLAEEITGDLLLDGVNKRFLRKKSDGAWENITSKMEWTDFPYLVPGENALGISIDGGPSLPGRYAQISYTPTYL